MTGLGLSEVVRVTVVGPRHRSEEMVRDLMEFEDFHPREKPRFRDPLLHEIEYRAELGYAAVQSLVVELNIKESVGILEQLSKPVQINPTTYAAQDLIRLLDELDNQSKPLVSKINQYINEKREMTEKLNNLYNIYTLLSALKTVRLDLEEVKRLNHFLFLVAFGSGGEIAELKRALPKAYVSSIRLENTVLFLVVSKKTEADEVDRVVRGIGLKPVVTPPGYPTKVDEAVAKLESEINLLKEKIEKISAEVANFVVRDRQLVLSLRDGYLLVKESLSRLAGAGEFKSFAVAEGYVPAEKVDEFKKLLGSKYFLHFSEGHGHHEPDQPTILRNSEISRPFENITLIQGHPKAGEIDPTPFVSIFFTIFYGLMFADMGHGAVILGFGLFMYTRVSGSLREWAKLLIFLGISASVFGFLIGEAFGFKVGKLINSPEVFHLVEEHGGAKQFSLPEVQRLLVFTLFLGITHMVVGYLLAIIKFFKEGEKAEALTVKLPSLAMYVFGVFFALAFFGAGGNIQGILSTTSPAPLLNMPTNFVGSVGIFGAIACIVVLLFGRFAAGAAGLGHKTSLISSIGSGLLEVLENIIHFLSNTISYARITILLIVHIALLLLLNTAWEALGIVSLPLLIVGNAGIILLEGLLVFIQAMRLHVYEFFSKFYDGTGKPFKKLSKVTPYVRISFR
ncbi:MAG: V-type ATPase 116kDa subunit family protein [Candidatus Caldarchaeum sp.]|nr:V-type ATPase 116kDa subunit family protein [Candidatus Caldarchaeum sp.]